MEGLNQTHPHPYVPVDLDLPGFVPGFLPQSTILGVFVLASLLVVSLVWFLSGDKVLSFPQGSDPCTTCMDGHKIRKQLALAHDPCHHVSEASGCRLLYCIYPACGKEYSKGDSRYAARESGVVAIEGITAVLEGPASLLAVYAIATKQPYSYILQVVISLGQLYGTAVYFITSLLDGDNFAASMDYYYAYYIFANGWWVVIPTLIVIRCWRKICAAFLIQEKRKTKTR
ncbi:hypothetical protein C3L33_13807, partial [Rhododendron williamsianum]